MGENITFEFALTLDFHVLTSAIVAKEFLFTVVDKDESSASRPARRTLKPKEYFTQDFMSICRLSLDLEARGRYVYHEVKHHWYRRQTAIYCAR